MIPYIEIVDKYTLKAFEMVEPKECWFELSYYDVGQFELYCIASKKNLAALQKGHYVKIPNKRFIWVITSVEYITTANYSRMISVRGYEAKWLLSKRIIKQPTELYTDLISSVSSLFLRNIGQLADTPRKINYFKFGTRPQTTIIPVTQATRGNLLTFISDLLKTYFYGTQVYFENSELYFYVLKGSDKTQTVKFSQSLDNLLSSNYYTSDENLGTYSYVVSKVEDIDYTKEYNKGDTGIDRAEILVDSNLSTKYTDTNGDEQETTPTSELYQGWQLEEGKKELTNHETIIEVKGEIDLLNSNYEFDVDFFIGDIVEVKDEFFNFSINERILKYTISQNAEGYTEKCDYGE